MNRTLQVIGLISWGIVGAFLYSAWCMIIGSGLIATIIFSAIWLLPIYGLQQIEEATSQRRMSRAFRLISESNNKGDLQ